MLDFELFFFFFFFQAEDGIRDVAVTGVQTCALPISCKLDFPDINGGWVAPEGTMGDVVTTLEKMYGAAVTAHLPRDQRHPWFGHPVRTTVGAKATDG